jgi:hypothetical protein
MFLVYLQKSFLDKMDKILIEKPIKIKNSDSCKRSLFFEVLNVYLSKQQTVNRKLSSILNSCFVKIKDSEFDVILQKLRENLKFPEHCWYEAHDRERVLLNIEEYCGVFMSLDKLIPRSSKFKIAHVITVFSELNCYSNFK